MNASHGQRSANYSVAFLRFLRQHQEKTFDFRWRFGRLPGTHWGDPDGAAVAAFVAQMTADEMQPSRRQRSHRKTGDEEDFQVTQNAFPATAVSVMRQAPSGRPHPCGSLATPILLFARLCSLHLNVSGQSWPIFSCAVWVLIWPPLRQAKWQGVLCR